MSDRDELAQLISDVISSANMQEDIWSDDLADAILTRWRLVPVDLEGPPIAESTRPPAR